MKSGTQDKVEGKMHQVKGKIKEAAGKVAQNRNLENKGKAENLHGKLLEKIGWLKKLIDK